MALIICPKCGKQISNRAVACPQCGATQEEIDGIFAEVERLRQEREARAVEEMRIQAEKDAEEARVRSEKRKMWWKKNLKYFIVSSVIIITVTAAYLAIIISFRWAEERQKHEESIALAQSFITKGDSCLNIYQFNEALSLYNEAYSCTQDEQIREIVQKKQDEIMRRKMENKNNQF